MSLQETYHPNQMKHFKERLTRMELLQCSRAYEQKFEDVMSLPDKCDANSKKPSNRGRKPSYVQNHVLRIMREFDDFSDTDTELMDLIPNELMNVIEGVARLDWYSHDRQSNVVAPNPIIDHPTITPWRCLYKCDANSGWSLKPDFTVPKPDFEGNWYLSPAGETRKAYLQGLCRDDNNADSLSVSRIVQCLKELEQVSTRSVQLLTGMGKRQSERYSRAVKMCMPELMEACNRLGLMGEEAPDLEGMTFGQAA